MPNISATRLRDLTDKAARFERLAANAERQLGAATALAESRGESLGRVNAILDKIVSAAWGNSVEQPGSWVNGAAMGSLSSPCPCQVREPSSAEKAAEDARQMLERLIDLESRVRAVVAVAQFAKEHKA